MYCTSRWNKFDKNFFLEVDILNTSICSSNKSFSINLICTDTNNRWFSLMNLHSSFTVLRKHITILYLILQQTPIWTTKHNTLILHTYHSNFAIHAPLLQPIINELWILLVISCEWPVICTKENQICIGWVLQILGVAHRCEVCVLELWRYDHIHVLEGLIVKIYAPQCESTFVANRTKLDVGVFYKGVHSYLVDAVVSYDSTFNDFDFLNVPNCKNIFTIDSYWYEVLWIIWETQWLYPILVEEQFR